MEESDESSLMVVIILAAIVALCCVAVVIFMIVRRGKPKTGIETNTDFEDYATNKGETTGKADQTELINQTDGNMTKVDTVGSDL